MDRHSFRRYTRIVAALLLGMFVLGLPVAVRAQAAPQPSQTQPPADPIAGPIRRADTLRIITAGADWLTGEFRVEQDGTIVIPRVGSIIVVDKMQPDAAKDIARQIEGKKLLKKADVAVYIIARRTREVIVNGAVTTQGRHPIKDNSVLSEALEMAVPLATADLSRVIVSRNGKDVLIDYKKFRNGESKDEQFNPKLEDDDRIFVYGLTPTEGTVRVTGEVKDSTKVIFPLTQGLTVGQLLNMVGGITEYADRNGIALVRGEERIKIPYDDIVKQVPGKDITLRDKDELSIPRLERPKQFKVAGAVRNASTFGLSSRTTLLDAIGVAGGPVDGAKQDQVEVRRTNALGVVTTYKYDLKKDRDAATEILDGDYINVPFGRQRNSLSETATIVGILSGIVIIFSQLK